MRLEEQLYVFIVPEITINLFGRLKIGFLGRADEGFQPLYKLGFLANSSSERGRPWWIENPNQALEVGIFLNHRRDWVDDTVA